MLDEPKRCTSPFMHGRGRTHTHTRARTCAHTHSCIPYFVPGEVQAGRLICSPCGSERGMTLWLPYQNLNIGPLGLGREQEGGEGWVAVQIDPNLMPDALHPGREGMELFARCILSEVEKMVK